MGNDEREGIRRRIDKVPPRCIRDVAAGHDSNDSK